MELRSAASRSRRIRVCAGDRRAAADTIGEWRPYVYPLLTPSGFAVTDEAPADHHYKQTVWTPHHDVGGHTFWINGAGKIAGPAPVTGVEELPDGPSAVFRHDPTWQAGTGEPL